MKIVNRTAHELSLARSSATRTVGGWILIGYSGVVFVIEATGSVYALILATTMLMCFAFGIFLLFTSVVEMIELDIRNRSLMHVCRGIFRETATRYDLRGARTHIESGSGHGGHFFIELPGSMRFLIDDTREQNAAKEVARFLKVPAERAAD